MSRSRSKNPPASVPVTRRRLRALDLRSQGMTYDQIAAALRADPDVDVSNSYGRPQAWKDVDAELSALRSDVAEKAEDVRRLELLRLDALTAAHWPAAVSGDVRATDAVLRCMDRRDKLLGLDAPTLMVTAEAPKMTEPEALKILDRAGVVLPEDVVPTSADDPDWPTIAEDTDDADETNGYAL